MLQKNDIIISTVRTYLRSIATITEDRDDLVGSTGFCVFKCKNELYYGYLSYLVHTEWFVAKVVSNSEGVSYPAITPTKLVTLPIILPPRIEQLQISDYLDQKTQQVDDLVKKNREKN